MMRAIRENWCLSCGNILKNICTCNYCDKQKESLPVLGCWYYESVVARAVWSFKYKRDKQILQELSTRILPSVLSELFAIKERDKDTILVPVPLHKTREKERGYNQSHLFARYLGAITNIPTESGAIERVKKTQPQAKCRSKKERIQNTQGAFAVRDSNPLRGRTIILVDDVVTTGSTAKEVVREIRKESKPLEVIVFCLAREQDNNMEM